jgi:hypothetical protein
MCYESEGLQTDETKAKLRVLMQEPEGDIWSDSFFENRQKTLPVLDMIMMMRKILTSAGKISSSDPFP